MTLKVRSIEWQIYCSGCTASDWIIDPVGQSESDAISIFKERGWRSVCGHTVCPRPACVRAAENGSAGVRCGRCHSRPAPVVDDEGEVTCDACCNFNTDYED